MFTYYSRFLQKINYFLLKCISKTTCACLEIDFAITDMLGFIAPQIILAMFIQMVQLISKMHVFCLFYACINHKRLLCMVDKVF